MILSALWGRRNGTSRRLLDSLAFLAHEPLDAYHAQETEHFSAEQLNDFRKDPFIFRNPLPRWRYESTSRPLRLVFSTGEMRWEARFRPGLSPSVGRSNARRVSA